MRNGRRGDDSAGNVFEPGLDTLQSWRGFRLATARRIHAAPSKGEPDRLTDVNTSVSEMIAVLDEKRCLMCGICVEVCVAYAIWISRRGRSNKEAIMINPKRCIGCGGCVAACPNKALSLKRQTPSPDQGAA
jgi:ferredoxin